ncbi:MAG: YggS family pyridoxal phosphate-dependent enzyme [Acidobacteria bacterium]|nr:YggS family pyridoxal phosphate-dependent enzyme [Acidobacteriota bacterium]
MSIADNLAAVRKRIAAAARRTGRRPEDIALMAVSKTFPADAIREAYAAGQRLFGENRVQEFADKSAALTELRDAAFHLIGHLQSNKAARAAQLFSAIDSLDSLALARRLDAAAAKADRRLAVLIEINVGGEDAKSGLPPDSPELEQLLTAAAELEHLNFRGFITIPPFTDDPEGARPYFRILRQLRDRVLVRHLPAIATNVLSMGMSHDFEVAIEEGSTCVRLGTAIFGERMKL